MTHLAQVASMLTEIFAGNKEDTKKKEVAPEA